MKLDKEKIKIWSTIGSRATFGMAILELAKLEEDLMVLTSDVSTSAGLDRFKKKYPDKYLDVGIAEQNLIGVATGLASEGYKVFTTTFAPFQTMRCCEQIKVNLGYMEQKVILVGIASGLVLGTLGYTHCSIEDLSIMRSIPNLNVISPADCGETVKSVFAAHKKNQPTYIRLTGGQNNNIVYQSDYEFEIGKPVLIKDGEDITIFATGTMVYNSLEASKILETKGISAKIINVHTLKPFKKDYFEKIIVKSKQIFTVEEHSVIGGLGSTISEFNSTLKNSPKHTLIGIPDSYGHGGTYHYMLQKCKLLPEDIANKIINELESL